MSHWFVDVHRSVGAENDSLFSIAGWHTFMNHFASAWLMCHTWHHIFEIYGVVCVQLTNPGLGWWKGYIYNQTYYRHQIGSINLFRVMFCSVAVCLTWLYIHLLSNAFHIIYLYIYIYKTRKSWVFLFWFCRPSPYSFVGTLHNHIITIMPDYLKALNI